MATTEIVPDLAIIDALQQPVWIAAPDGTVVHANPYWRAYTGLDEPASLGDGWATAVHPDDVGRVMDRFRHASRAGTTYDVEYRFRRWDGVDRWHLARVAPVRDAAGDVVRWAGTSVDVDDRRRAEGDQARLAAIVEGSQEAIVGRLLDGTITSWNPAAERLYGFAAREIIGQPISVLVPPDHGVEMDRINEGLAGGAAVPPFDTVRLRKDGTRVPVSISLSPIRDRSGTVVGVSALARDLTDQRTAERERREREDQARLTAEVGAAFTARLPLADQLRRCAAALVAHLDAAFARVWTLDGDRPHELVLRASAGLYEHLDGPHGRIAVGTWKIGRIAAERRPHLTNAVVDDPEVSDRAWAEREGMVAFAGYPLLVGERLLGVLAVFARHPLGHATLEGLGAVADVVAVGIDRAEAEAARERLLAEEIAARALAETAEVRYRGLFEGVADAILVADDQRRYRDANTAATELLGYRREELLVLRVEDVVAEGPSWTAAEFERFRTEGRWQGELELRRKDGTTVLVEAVATTVPLPGGAVNLSALRDVSERREAQRRQQWFLAAVSHDLKNPIASVRAQAQLLLMRADRGIVDTDVLRTRLARIDAASHRMEAQLDELQEVFRLLAGQPLDLRTAPTDLVELARAAVVDAQAATADHNLLLDATERGVTGNWDPVRLRRVLDNLLGNAVKYSPAGGRVTVSVRRVEGSGGARAVITVADAGVGIPAADLPHIFDPYRRGSNVRGGSVRGTGIGLAGVRQIVAQHGGTIAVESREGEGSKFTVSLPIAGTPAETTATVEADR